MQKMLQMQLLLHRFQDLYRLFDKRNGIQGCSGRRPSRRCPGWLNYNVNIDIFSSG